MTNFWSGSVGTTSQSSNVDKSKIVVEEIQVMPSVTPPVPPCPKRADSIVAQQMSSLSQKDREEVYYGLHGISLEDKESPEFLQGKLVELDDALQQLRHKQTISSYETALAIDPSYVKDPDFCVKFLRADRFDASAAALRIARHFEAKLELFGLSKLCQDIEQDDLGQDDMDALYSGTNQSLPVRDRAGRLVSVWVPSPSHRKLDTVARLRRCFYATMAHSDDIELQKKGTVIVVYAVRRQSDGFDSEGAWKITGLAKALPIRLEAIHICHDSYLFVPLTSIVKIAASFFTRLRIRTHHGSHSECMYSLMTFGIPAETFPINLEDGKILNDDNIELWEKRRKYERLRQQQEVRRIHQEQQQQQEESLVGGGEDDNNVLPNNDFSTSWDNSRSGSPTSTTTGTTTTTSTTKHSHGTKSISCIAVPGRTDILFGRGKKLQQHVGNMKFRNLIESCSAAYNRSSKEKKKVLTEEIVQHVQEKFGGRFLKDDTVGWIEVDDETARLKVSHAFRSVRAALRKHNQPTNGNNETNSDDNHNVDTAADTYNISSDNISDFSDDSSFSSSYVSNIAMDNTTINMNNNSKKKKTRNFETMERKDDDYLNDGINEATDYLDFVDENDIDTNDHINNTLSNINTANGYNSNAATTMSLKRPRKHNNI